MVFRKGEFARGEENIPTGTTLVATYHTVTELHAMMEPHAIIAQWQGDTLTVYEGSQWVVGG
ncbi:hypothetical protein [Trichothermofontia sp.]